MIWYRKLYLGSGLLEKKEKLIRKIECNAGTVGLYVITLAANERDLLDIFSTDILLQPVMHGHCPMIVGLAKGYDAAVKLATDIVMEVYEHTGGFDVRSYLASRMDEGEEPAYHYPMEQLKPRRRIWFQKK